MNKKNIIGERIKLARIQATPRVTQLDLAARLQTKGMLLEQSAISKIEAGAREVTDIEISAIAEALGVSLTWLFGQNDK